MNGRPGPAGRPDPTPLPSTPRSPSPSPSPSPYERPPYARFVPSDLPVLTSTPARADHAVRAAGRALARLGRSDLGGHLVLTAGHDRPSGDLAAQERAVARAVERALRRRPPRLPLAPPAPPG